MSEYVMITETITFDGHGGSTHVWRLPDGEVFSSERFAVSPIFLKPAGSWEYGSVPPNVRQIVRQVFVPPETVRQER